MIDRCKIIFRLVLWDFFPLNTYYVPKDAQLAHLSIGINNIKFLQLSAWKVMTKNVPTEIRFMADNIFVTFF